MGGFGSGRVNGRYGTARTTVEACNVLDINALHRKKLLKPGAYSLVSWTVSHHGNVVGTNSVTVAAARHGVALSYTVTAGDGTMRDYMYVVPLRYLPCTYGGLRPYFLCPGPWGTSCGRRALKLYKPPSQHRFACRSCYNLTYQSCNSSGDIQYAAAQRVRKASQKLGLTHPDDIYLVVRPKGMHVRTFEHLKQSVIKARDDEYDAFYCLLERRVEAQQSKRHRLQ